MLDGAEHTPGKGGIHGSSKTNSRAALLRGIMVSVNADHHHVFQLQIIRESTANKVFPALLLFVLPPPPSSLPLALTGISSAHSSPPSLQFS